MKPFVLELTDWKEDTLVVTISLTPVEGYGHHRGRDLKVYEVYQVTGAGKILKGRIEERTETLERKTKGRTYVNRRWTGSRTVWMPVSATVRHRMPRRTRQNAIAALFGRTDAKRLKEN